MFKRIAVGLAALGAAAGGYLLFIRPWQLRWGATDEEVARSMPGDDVVRHPTFNATRAVTIKARPEETWPWLVQIGTKRAGWYSYDWLDNPGHHSAERIIPEFQHLEVGDRIPMSPDGKQDPLVKALDPNHWMLWGDTEGGFTWYWGLYPLEERQTRLITRVRLCYRWTSPMILFHLLVEFTDIVMMRKCMLGIKQRAEREAAATHGTIPVPYTQSDGLAIYRFGQGEPILFMPYPHAASVVGDPIPAALIEGLEQANRQVITFDPPGAGRSTRRARLDLAVMLDSAEEALQCCGVNGPVDVVGHSQGAFAALAFAIERPQRVRRLILIGAGAGGPSWMRAPGALWNRSHPAFWRFGLWASLYQLSRRLAAQKLMFNVVSQASWVERSRAPQRRVSLLDWVRPAHSRTQWGQVARRLDYRPRLHEVHAPTLVLVGRHDPQMPPACAQELAAGIPNARLVLFERSGHYPFLEEPDAFWASVRAFLLEEVGAKGERTDART